MLSWKARRTWRLRHGGPVRWGLVLGAAWALGLSIGPSTAAAEDPPTSSRSIRLSGLVLTPKGEPLAAAQIRLLPLRTNHANLGAWIAPRGEEDALSDDAIADQTDDTGGFQLEVPNASLLRLTVQAPGRVSMQQVLLPLVEDRHLAPVALEEDVPLTVVCLDDAGKPLDDVLIFAFGPRAQSASPGGWTVADRFVRSDARGQAVLPRRRGESLSLTARVAGTVTMRDRRVEPSLAGPLEWRLPRTPIGRVVRAQVFEPSGAPAPGVLVGLGDLAMPLGKTDAEGLLELEGLPGEDITWQLFPPDGRHLRHHAFPSAAPFERLDTLRLPPRRPLEGQVVEAGTRRPLSGVLIWPGNDPGRAVRTDLEGRFLLPDYGTGSPWIQAEAAGYLPQLQRVQEDGSTWIPPLLILTPSSSLQGQAVDGEGRPLKGVRLSVKAVSPSDLPAAFRPDVQGRTVSEAGGRFQLRGLHPRAGHELRAELEGYATAVLQVSEAAKSQQPLRVQLIPARTAFGRVVDGDERPVAEAKVVVADAAGKGKLEPVFSGADGGFRVPELPPDRLDLEVSKAGYPPVQVRAIEIPAGQDAVDLGIVLLRRGLALRGRVIDAEDRPVEGALVLALPAPEDSQKSLANRQLAQRPARSDAEGWFRLEGLLPGQRIFLVVQHPDFVEHALEGVDIPSEDLQIVLQRGVRLTGRVEDVEGQALAGASVRVGGVPRPAGTIGVFQDSDANDFETHTDDQGNFEVGGIIPGPLRVQASLEGYQPAEPRRLEVTLEDAAEEVVLVLHRGRTLQGKVENVDGEPVEGAVLTLAHTRERSNADGVFLLAGLAEGRHDLDVRHPEYNWHRQTVTVGDSSEAVEIVLRGGGAVQGRVLDETGLPLSGARVRLEKQARRDRHAYQATSDADGHFQIDSMALGPYRLEATRAGYAASRWPDLLEVEGPVDGLEIILRPGAEIIGQVRGLDFEALSAVEVEADDGRGEPRPAVVDYEGNYRVTDLAPGTWTVRGRLEGGRRQAEARVAVSEGVRRVRRDLQFGGGLTLEGQVLLAGEPLPRTWIALRGAGQDVERNVTSDYQGRFRFADLKEGTYRLSLSNSREMLVHNEDIELVQDRDLVLDLAAAEIRGRVSDRDGQSVEEALVRLQQMHGEALDEPGSLITVATDGSGRFHLARVSAGSYTLQVEKEGLATWRQSLPIAAGETVGPLDVVLDAAPGLRLDVRCGADRIPAWVDLSLFDAAGQHVRSSRRRVDPAGRVEFMSVPAGSWTVRVGGEGCAAQQRLVTVPAEPQAVLLPGEARLFVKIGALAESTLRARLRLWDAAGQPFGQPAAAGSWVTSWPLTGGEVQVHGLSAGRWRVEVTATDGQRWQGQLTLSEGGVASLSL